MPNIMVAAVLEMDKMISLDVQEYSRPELLDHITWFVNQTNQELVNCLSYTRFKFFDYSLIENFMEEAPTRSPVALQLTSSTVLISLTTEHLQNQLEESAHV